MATILYINSEIGVGNGSDVHFVTGGKQYMLHFDTEPTEADRDECILLFEQKVLDHIAENIIKETEEVLI